MKKCPNCNELVGDSVEKCFNCKYSFILKRVVMKQEQQRILQEQQEAEYKINRSKNALFEYEVVVMKDSRGGKFDTTEYRNILQRYSSQG